MTYLDERTDLSAADAMEAAATELACHIAPWDTMTEVRRIAASRGLPSDKATAERAMRLVREAHVPNAPGVVGWGPA